MSILSGYKKVKNYILSSEGGYKLLSRWTSSNTVECDDGDTLQDKINALNSVVATVFADAWSSSAPYTQTVTVNGMTSDWIPSIPTLVSSHDVETDLLMSEALSCVNLITSADNCLVFTCYEDKPSIDFNVRISGVIGG